jgi:hypothetical protein
MKLPGISLIFTAAMLALADAPVVVAERTFAADAEIFHDSNLTRAQNAADIRADGAARLNAEAGEAWAATGSDTFDAAAFARGEIYRRYHGLNNAIVGGRAALRHKFALGYDAPWILVAAEGSHDDYNDSLRDSNRFTANVEFGTRFTPAWDAASGVVYDRRYDNHGESLVPGIPGTVFDLRGFGGYARVGYAFNEIVYAGAKLGVRRGDVESTAQRSLPIFLVSTAIAADPVFGSSDLFAYRLRGTTWTGSAMTSIALDERSSINLSYADERTYAAYGNQYKSRIVSLLFTYRP